MERARAIGACTELLPGDRRAWAAINAIRAGIESKMEELAVP